MNATDSKPQETRSYETTAPGDTNEETHAIERAATDNAPIHYDSFVVSTKSPMTPIRMYLRMG